MSKGDKGIRLYGYLLAVLAIFSPLLPACAFGDEVDDILKIKENNHNRVKRMSSEYTIETRQPKSLKDPKTVKMRYRMKLEKLPPQERKKGSNNPWRLQAEVIEPMAMNMKVEGDQAWFLDQHKQWVELQLTAEMREQFAGMSERAMGPDPVKMKQNFSIKVLRHNNPIFGPRTRTVEYIPKGQAKLFARMEEDMNDDGLPLETRIFDDKGKNTVKITVKKHRKIKGIPVVDEMDAESDTPAGIITSTTRNENVEVETE